MMSCIKIKDILLKPLKSFIMYLYLCKRKRTHNIHAHVKVGSSIAMTGEGNNSGSSEEKYKE